MIKVTVIQYKQEQRMQIAYLYGHCIRSSTAFALTNPTFLFFIINLLVNLVY